MNDATPDQLRTGPSRDTPRFQQIVQDIKRQIVDGSLPEHAALPSERRIAEETGISRMTARRALDALEAEGLVYSADRRGRFVSPKRVSYDVSNMVSFVADAESRGTALGIEVIRAQEGQADAALAARLGLKPGAAIYEYTRLFRQDGHAIFVETEYVDAARCPDFLSHDLHQSTTRLLDSHYDLVAHTGDIMIRMRGAHPEETQLLGLAQSQSGIELTQVIRDASGRPFCFGRQFWRGELAEFSARAIVGGFTHG
ncbi:GntR family transcriptional regulator [Ruegeria pomeroyi]|uniref:GntR family transcriptional regulator n=1 Tax=Ruegeria pomeroyi TaxID=89184 RepID=A0A9Q3WIM6_9RHOB|nr:GntR family transcriptional regulator [Ruegeria pomeroyi]MCE8536553.1 GntR family transcriptional regulator [Ruegeria pomeroyi]